MPNLSDIAKVVREIGKPPGTWSLLIYGPPKMGKTRLAATIAKVPYIQKIAFFDLENGYETLVTMVKDGLLTDEQAKKITIYAIPDTVQVPMAFETIMKCLTVRQEHIICELHGKISCVDCAIKNEKGQVDKLTGQVFDIRTFGKEDVVILDTASQLAHSTLSYYLLGKPAGYKAGWDEYGPQGRDLNNALCIVQRARTNFIVTAHELGIEFKENDEEHEKIYPLIGTKNFSRTAAKYFSHVAYMHKHLGLHKGGTSSTYREDLVTGSRGGWKLEQTKDLDLSKLFAQLNTPSTTQTP